MFDVFCFERPKVEVSERPGKRLGFKGKGLGFRGLGFMV